MCGLYDFIKIIINSAKKGINMKSLLKFTAICGALIMMTGCGGGGGDSQSNGSNTNPNTENPSTPLTEQQIQNIIAISNETVPGIARENLLHGIVDTLIYGGDQVLDGEKKCSSGSYTKTGDVVIFDNCKGLFETATGLNQHQYLTVVSGKVTVTEGSYDYQDVVLLDADSGESQKVSGKFNISGNDNNAVVTTDKLNILATEKTANAFADVTYLLENYKLNYDKKSGSELALTTIGTLTVTNSTVGDYKIKFETTQPLFVQIDAAQDDAIVSYPYNGVLKITDLNNSATTTLTANNDKKTALVSIIANQKELANGTQNWADILGYSK